MKFFIDVLPYGTIDIVLYGTMHNGVVDYDRSV